MLDVVRVRERHEPLGRIAGAAAAVAALDPYVRLYVAEGKGGTDWEPFQAVAHWYGSGTRDAVVSALADVLEDFVEEMEARYGRLKGVPADLRPEDKITPALSRNRRLNMPLVLINIDEFQEYIAHEKYGPRILAALIRISRQGRAMGVMLNLATQRPDAKTMPEDLRANILTRFALHVGSWQASDIILGAGAKSEGLDASTIPAPSCSNTTGNGVVCVP